MFKNKETDAVNKRLVITVSTQYDLNTGVRENCREWVNVKRKFSSTHNNIKLSWSLFKDTMKLYDLHVKRIPCCHSLVDTLEARLHLDK